MKVVLIARCANVKEEIGGARMHEFMRARISSPR